MSLAYNTDFSRLPGMTHGNTTNSDNPFEPFFGPISVQDNQNVKADDVFSHETYNLPKAYEGKNLHLGDILDFLITRDDDWYTSRVLPWRMTDQLSVTWNIFRFNKTMADLEPHQGVPRYVTAETETRSDRLVRRGLAFIIEHGFFSTEQGRKHYMYNLEQITSAVHETCFFGVLHALLSGKNHYKEWNRQYGRRVNRVSDLLSLERNRWAVCQKTERGLYLLDAELKDSMKYQNVVPDTWIFPSKMSIYVSMVPSTEVSYQEVGRSDAVADNNSISKAPKKLLTFRGCTVHETRPFDMDFSGSPSELLRREQMIGTYYQMLPFSRHKKCEYTTDSRAIYIFNMELDRFEKIHITDAIEHCFRFDKREPDGCNVHPAHGAIQNEIGLPSTKETSLRDDPLLCHSVGKQTRDATDEVCKYFGDIQLNHFNEQDLRDWIDSVVCAYKEETGEVGATLTDWFNSIIAGDRNIDEAAPADVPAEANLGGVTADPAIVSHLQNAWDPVLAAALHNNTMPVNVSLASKNQMFQRFTSEFPQTWKNLMSVDDMAFARKQVAKEAMSKSGQDLTNYLSKVNEHYANHITERVLDNRSNFVSGGLLEAALVEMANPSKSSRRTKAQKRTLEFIDKFDQTAEYFKRENPELLDNSSVMREILRDYIQPLSRTDAAVIEQHIENEVMAGNVVTSDILKQLRSNLRSSTEKDNMQKLSQQLESAAVDLSGVKGGKAPATFKPGSMLDSTWGTDYYVESKAKVLADASATMERNERRKMEGRYGAVASLERQAFNLFLNTKISDRALKAFAEHNIIVPFGFLLVRPFERYDMCSAILCKAGNGLGNTYMGHNDFQLTDDIIHKVHVGHYTFYSKSIIHDERQYQICENVIGAGYKGGENTRFYKSKGDLLDDIHAESFRASILCMMIPYRTNGGSTAPTLSNPLDVTGSLHPTLYADTDIPEGEIDEAQYPGARYYAEYLELKKLTSYASDATEHFMSPFKYLNTVAFQGAQYMYNPESRSFTDRIANTGHWGNVYNGCAKVRNGENAFLREEPQLTPLG